MAATTTKKQPSIRSLQRKIKELETKYEELRASVGYEELEGWKPDSRIERQYGWVFSWLAPLRRFFLMAVGKLALRLETRLWQLLMQLFAN